ncbi:unnamed protein product [Rangifer tarandus platyrhynchus]|uniref:Uncharacterized protein n=2 Tax=Rangifer tarandus platyrhynchus TaxID=3082113 RepID=A0ABN8ZKE4_RANTA|nr:unnamed protein product [Rangifer tarandus platyrhynchus]CAI9706109.1 unnamed protein product [Rangifer tarandus platyrhynchus]
MVLMTAAPEGVGTGALLTHFPQQVPERVRAGVAGPTPGIRLWPLLWQLQGSWLREVLLLRLWKPWRRRPANRAGDAPTGALGGGRPRVSPLALQLGQRGLGPRGSELDRSCAEPHRPTSQRLLRLPEQKSVLPGGLELRGVVCGIVLCVTWKCCRDLSTSEEPQEQGALTGLAQPFDTEVTLGARVNQWPAEGLLAGECLRA